jgi:hypothetical protein
MSLRAEADGNRTRQGTLAPSPVLKTGGPTRRPDASERIVRCTFASERHGQRPPRGTETVIRPAIRWAASGSKACLKPGQRAGREGGRMFRHGGLATAGLDSADGPLSRAWRVPDVRDGDPATHPSDCGGHGGRCRRRSGLVVSAQPSVVGGGPTVLPRVRSTLGGKSGGAVAKRTPNVGRRESRGARRLRSQCEPSSQVASTRGPELRDVRGRSEASGLLVCFGLEPVLPSPGRTMCEEA